MTDRYENIRKALADMSGAACDDYKMAADWSNIEGRVLAWLVDGCHCATCTCNPGMTPAIRFDTSPAAQEGAVRDRLIALGWTPPGSQQPAVHPAITHCDNCGCDWLDNGLNPIGCPYCKQPASAVEHDFKEGA